MTVFCLLKTKCFSGRIRTLKALTGLFLLFLSVLAFGSEEGVPIKIYFQDKKLSISYENETITDLDINAYSGNYRFVPSLNKTVTVKIKQLNSSSLECNLQPVQNGGQIIIVSEESRKNRCSSDYELEIPGNMNVAI